MTLLFLIALCVLLPPKYDPAIRWKEWNNNWKERINKERHK